MLSYFIPIFIVYLVTLNDVVQSQSLKQNSVVTVKTEGDKTTTKINCEEENGKKHDVGIVHKRSATGNMYAFCTGPSVCYRLNTGSIIITPAIIARFHAGTTEMGLVPRKTAGTVILKTPENDTADLVMEGRFEGPK
ncbi:hypothetical protein DdX_17832 [Ditylenchus destructor]|uniref:Uncharacterized protein n=1 Tax=Ditylenchus destructor TaxID=166010 RepID=A0AAD4MMB6_9BILA|nr:hypothetical protein DdX_17832 [Ditylenchus destructor]